MANFEYLHTWIDAVATDVDSGEESDYDARSIEEALNDMGQSGWELVNMTPHWEWGYETIMGVYGAPAPYSVPDYISGWYCTFKRPLG